MKNMTSQVCIIGSGPGGLVTSLFLSKYRIPHLLVDKSTFPRDKVCGENMDGRVAAILSRVDPEIINELKSKGLVKETWDFHITLPKGEIPISFSKDNTPRLLSKRIDFDDFLYKKAISSEYCEVLDGQLINDYRYDGDKIVFEGKGVEITSDIGVVACGYQSSLLKNRKKETQMFFFNRSYLKNKNGFKDNQIQTYYFDNPAKCCLLIVPLPNNEFNVDIGISKLEYKNLKIRLEDLLQLLISGDEGLKTWFSTAQVIDKARGIHTPVASKYKHFSDRNLVYVGGTAFCVNPITGLGIGNAMAMAEIAAGEIKDWIKSDSFLAKDTYSYERKARKRLQNVFILNGTINLFFRNLEVTTPILVVILKSKFIIKLLSTSSLLKNISKPAFYLKKLFSKSN
jgi:flavin-dependent dehydrogenase